MSGVEAKRGVEFTVLGGKWGNGVLAYFTLSFLCLPLLCAGYSVKLLLSEAFTNFEKRHISNYHNIFIFLMIRIH